MHRVQIALGYAEFYSIQIEAPLASLANEGQSNWKPDQSSITELDRDSLEYRGDTALPLSANVFSEGLIIS